jgi:hypothetical protein
MRIEASVPGDKWLETREHCPGRRCHRFREFGIVSVGKDTLARICAGVLVQVKAAHSDEAARDQPQDINRDSPFAGSRTTIMRWFAVDSKPPAAWAAPRGCPQRHSEACAPLLSERRSASRRSWTHPPLAGRRRPSLPILMPGTAATVAAGHRSGAGCRRTTPAAPRPRPAGTPRSGHGARSGRRS